MNFFNEPALGYNEYKQQLVSMRLFLFPAVVAAMYLIRHENKLKSWFQNDFET